MQIVWLDVESTGLDEQSDLLLEVAVGFATLENMFELTNRRQYVFGYSEQSLSRMNDFVRNMHTKNGLLEEVAKSNMTLSTAEDELLTLIPEVDDWENKPTLAGSSLKLDYGLLRTWMPKLHARLHYRLLDVSAVKLFARGLGMEQLPKIEQHRAANDIDESVLHAQKCAEFCYSLPHSRRVSDR